MIFYSSKLVGWCLLLSPEVTWNCRAAMRLCALFEEQRLRSAACWTLKHIDMDEQNERDALSWKKVDVDGVALHSLHEEQQETGVQGSSIRQTATGKTFIQNWREFLFEISSFAIRMICIEVRRFVAKKVLAISSLLSVSLLQRAPRFNSWLQIVSLLLQNVLHHRFL